MFFGVSAIFFPFLFLEMQQLCTNSHFLCAAAWLSCFHKRDLNAFSHSSFAGLCNPHSNISNFMLLMQLPPFSSSAETALLLSPSKKHQSQMSVLCLATNAIKPACLVFWGLFFTILQECTWGNLSAERCHQVIDGLWQPRGIFKARNLWWLFAIAYRWTSFVDPHPSSHEDWPCLSSEIW